MPLNHQGSLIGFVVVARSRAQFNAGIARGDPATMKAAWQRFYTRGELPEATDDKPVDHTVRRRLKEPRE